MAKLIRSPVNPGGPPSGNVSFGYEPADPVLTGHKITLVVRRNGTTEPAGPVPVLHNETRSVATGTAAQKTLFQFGGGGAWTGGGGDATATLKDASGGTVDTDTFTIG